MTKRSNISYGLPGGRAYYRGSDAYAAQSYENEARIQQRPGYIKAVLTSDFPISNGVTSTVLWATVTSSNFIPALSLYGWGYNASTGQFTCLNSGLYQIALSFVVTTAVSSWLPSIMVTRGGRTFTLVSATIGRAVCISSDFQFLQGDVFIVQVQNTSGGSVTLTGLTGAGGAAEVQSCGFNLWQVDI